MMLMSSVTVCGTAIVTFGTYRRDFLIMFGGRLAAGFAESLVIALQAIIVTLPSHLFTRAKAPRHTAVVALRYSETSNVRGLMRCSAKTSRRPGGSTCRSR
jgi:hypothetical protein